MDDLFDSSLNLEDTHYKEGYDEGHSHGLVAGKEEARQVGLKVGFEIGEELGFYRGCVDIWASALRLDPTCFSPRAKTIIGQMEELIGKYPLMDPENVQVQEIMDSLRIKFKLAALLFIGSIFAYFPGIEADTPNTVAYSSVFVSVVSLIIGNIGRRRSRPGLLRFYAIVSSIAMLLLVVSLAKKHLLLKAIQDSKLWRAGKYDVNDLSHFQIGLVLYLVTLSVLKLCTVKAVVSLLFNMAPPKKTS